MSTFFRPIDPPHLRAAAVRGAPLDPKVIALRTRMADYAEHRLALRDLVAWVLRAENGAAFRPNQEWRRLVDVLEIALADHVAGYSAETHVRATLAALVVDA